MTAQIEAALAAGIEPTHLDTHMGAALLPALLPIYVELGRRYRLPVLIPRRLEEYLWILRVEGLRIEDYRARARALERSGAPIIDGFRMTPGVPSAESDAAYRSLVADIPPGVTFLSIHCSAPGDIELIVPGRPLALADRRASDSWRCRLSRCGSPIRASGQWASARSATSTAAGFRAEPRSRSQAASPPPFPEAQRAARWYRLPCASYCAAACRARLTMRWRRRSKPWACSPLSPACSASRRSSRS